MRLGYLAFVFFALAITASAQKPKIRLVAVTDTVNMGRAFKTYEIEITNRDRYSEDLFTPAPALPPCGKNANSSRTWIHIYNERGVRFYGWCGINVRDELASLKFNISEGDPQPKKLFIDIIDRAELRILRSGKITIK